MPSILVTGGAGFIGTHILSTLACRGRSCISLDNYSNSSPAALEHAHELARGGLEAFESDIRDERALDSLLASIDVESVIHLAGLKAVGESVLHPDRYHDNNVAGTERLLAALARTRVRKFVFSSSATVYGAASRVPIDERAPTAPASPYGRNKLDIERMLRELAERDPSWRIAILRYFNPVGAHESGLIGEDPRGTPNNLMPYVCQAALGKLPELRIFGDDYPTRDGTGVRDYIHVMDLADGHVAALAALDRAPPGSVLTVNLGTGRGYSVRELVETFERVNGVTVPRRIVGRRPGDVAVCYAEVSRARDVLHWQAKRGLKAMCRDAWRWQSMNPDGYA